MLTLLCHVAVASPPAPVLPAEEERFELDSLEHLRLEPKRQVPAWPDVRPPRHDDSAWVGLAIGAVGAVLVASVIPDQVVLRERWFNTLSSCERKAASGLSIGCI